ncbi:hypothetical protein M0D21_18065 [Aquimarina sp. D1M17]|uniref:VOC family protein n=1 Tax=Aquimarina acroporae TaxID=2937283 RepID=UPI0020BF0743|nr:hypothetical protein [Aquimarina acroporae]MCK8523494.1 hypothetical protein [Aquimarina acroporae]
MNLNLLVIRTSNPELLKTQYEKIGFKFDYHQHGKGPYHYACEYNGFVFEIYPLTKSMTKADGNLRLGFDISNLSSVIDRLRGTDWIIKSDIKKTEWGIIAVIQDLDGRKIELKNK